MFSINLNKAQGRKFRMDQAALMNIPELYDNEVERKQTSILLLPKDEQAKLERA